MELPSLRRRPYHTSLLDLPRGNLLIFFITSISFIGILVLFVYAGYAHSQYMGNFKNPDMGAHYFLEYIADYIHVRFIGAMEKPEWPFNIYSNHGFFYFLAILIFGITALVQFVKLQECLRTDLCLLRFLENIDARLGIYFSGEPKKNYRSFTV
jgi:hypothetical protein